jgi:hypothetical protein
LPGCLTGIEKAARRKDRAETIAGDVRGHRREEAMDAMSTDKVDRTSSETEGVRSGVMSLSGGNLDHALLARPPYPLLQRRTRSRDSHQSNRASEASGEANVNEAPARKKPVDQVARKARLRPSAQNIVSSYPISCHLIARKRAANRNEAPAREQPVSIVDTTAQSKPVDQVARKAHLRPSVQNTVPLHPISCPVVQRIPVVLYQAQLSSSRSLHATQEARPNARGVIEVGRRAKAGSAEQIELQKTTLRRSSAIQMR